VIVVANVIGVTLMAVVRACRLRDSAAPPLSPGQDGLP
jgi:hypothetical protein